MKQHPVLILVLMEYALWQIEYEILTEKDKVVLILVLMEYALWQLVMNRSNQKKMS